MRFISILKLCVIILMIETRGIASDRDCRIKKTLFECIYSGYSSNILRSSWFNTTEVIHDIRLKDNNIYVVEEDSFKGLIYLQKIWLNNNFITMILKNTFSDNKELNIINLSNNLITYIDPEAFSSLTKLTFLDVKQNYLHLMDSNLLLNSAGLKSLIFSENYLDGNNNSDQIRATRAFHRKSQGIKWYLQMLSSPNLETINAANVGLLDMTEEEIPDSSKIISIDFSYNNLTNFPLRFFDKMGVLKKLILDHNNIVRMEWNTILDINKHICGDITKSEFE